MKTESLEGPARLPDVARQVDALGVAFDGRLVAPAHTVAQVAHLVHPTTLVSRTGIDGFQRRRQSRSAVAEHQLQLPAGQSAPLQIPQKSLPGSLALAPCAHEGQQLPLAVRAHPVGHQQQHPLRSKWVSRL